MDDVEKQDSTSIKAEIAEAQPPDDIAAPNAKFQLYNDNPDPLKRRLKQRHVQMIAIAGTIGTGLFLGSGEALRVAGPLGALIAYVLVGTVAYSSLCSVGEMSTFAPISGTFPHFGELPTSLMTFLVKRYGTAARWVDPAFGFAVGWNYFYGQAISVPVEVAAAVILLTFWDNNASHAAIYTAVICVFVCAINIFGVRYFGESEFFFALIKLSTIIGLLLAGLVIDLGGGPNHDRIGFRANRFLAIMSVIIQAAFSFIGMELVAIAASETESPRRNIGKAVNRVVYRIVIFYILGILMIGMLVSYDDDALLNTSGNAAQSPFVIAFNRAGVKALPHIINAAVFTSAFSAGNSYLFCGSRILYGLALRGQGPRFLTYCTKNGLPLTAVLVTCCFSLLSFMTVSSGAEQVFYWLQNLTATGGFIGWFCINLTYIFFRRGMVSQGFDLKENIYNHSWQPYLAWWGIFWTIFFTLVNGYAVFFNFNVSDFLVAYINLPIFATLYFGYKFIMRTTVWKPKDMDMVTGIPSIEETETVEVPQCTLLEKIAAIIF
ncbi:general APC amino acid permease [Guyanagaster necrorhizus]|uniref:General APC amino acid permease n=1 Tax=Guyanagaster necrorhizus TaxID=856835 RepID=A0A9P8ARP3_9AGAR|nr:general APC amino acid permease [Guyanagaster necrorhizus MCA 3950]KAG7445116.1 general APC amino acid permease [Guyanagaster necrorhizus MCA 3950]